MKRKIFFGNCWRIWNFHQNTLEKTAFFNNIFQIHDFWKFGKYYGNNFWINNFPKNFEQIRNKHFEIFKYNFRKKFQQKFSKIILERKLQDFQKEFLRNFLRFKKYKKYLFQKNVFKILCKYFWTFNSINFPKINKRGILKKKIYIYLYEVQKFSETPKSHYLKIFIPHNSSFIFI